jgi:hypothetical protein
MATMPRCQWVTCLEHTTCPSGLSMRKCCSSREVTACCWRKFSITTPVGAAGRRVVDTQLCIGGPVRDMLMLSGVFSVILEWCDASASAA